MQPDRQDLFSAAAKSSLLAGIPDEALAWLAERAETIALSSGQTLARESESGTLLILLRGRLRLTSGPSAGRVLDPGETTETYRVAPDAPAFEVLDEATLARFTPAVWKDFAAAWPDSHHALFRNLHLATAREALRVALHRGELFGPVSPQLAIEIENEMEPIALEGGERLFEGGDPGDSLYVVASGRVRVLIQRDGQEVAVAELGAGEPVGEMSVITAKPRTGAVYAIRDTQLARISTAAYQRLLEKHPVEVMRLFAGTVVQRLEEANSGRGRESTRVSTFAVIPVNAAVPLLDFCEELTRSLSQYGASTWVSSDRVNQHFGGTSIAEASEGEADHIRLSDWLSDLEHDNSYVVYVADLSLTQWSVRCLRQADHVLIVGWAEGDETPGVIEEAMARLPQRAAPRRSLVLLHALGRNPHDTARWLKGRDVERFLHARLETPGHLDRVARFLTGRAVGVALGGGFARGLAHVGVFRALRDLGLPIDAVGGTSMGAVVAALWAMEWDPERIVEQIREGCRESFNDMTFPFLAFKKGGKFSSLLQRFYGSLQIEDLWSPYFCVSANLNRAELEMHTRGELTRAVLASTRAPGVFPPIVYDSELHVDGGLMNNVPVDLMKTFTNQGLVFGVDVSPPHELENVPDYGYDVSGWDALRMRFGWGKKKTWLPSILLVMMRTLEFGGISYKNARIRYADLYLMPPLLKFKRTDWQFAEQIVETSYEYALAEIRQWLDGPGGAKGRLIRGAPLLRL